MPVPESPPTAISSGGGGIDEAARELEIFARAAFDCGGLFGFGLRDPRRRHLGANRRPHREKEGKRRQRVEVLRSFGLEQIAVEHDIGGAHEATLGEVHQQEGEIVEHIARCDQRVELDGVEQHRALLDEHDVAEVKVAMSAADQAAPAALREKRADARVGGTARRRQRSQLGLREKRGHLPERGVVLLDIVRECRDPGLRFDRARPGVRRGDRAAKRIGQRRVDLARVGQPVERRLLVEAAHLDRPFDRRAGTVQREPAVRPARDRHHATVDLGSEWPVDLELRLAGLFAAIERRVIQEREAHGMLDLERAGAGEKHRGGMGIDALDRLSAMRRGVGEQREDRLLGPAVVHSRCASLVAGSSDFLISRRGY